MHSVEMISGRKIGMIIKELRNPVGQVGMLPDNGSAVRHDLRNPMVVTTPKLIAPRVGALLTQFYDFKRRNRHIPCN